MSGRAPISKPISNCVLVVHYETVSAASEQAQIFGVGEPVASSSDRTYSEHVRSQANEIHICCMLLSAGSPYALINFGRSYTKVQYPLLWKLFFV